MKGMRAKIAITYETITPESVESGDYAESGWYLPGGWFHALESDDKRDERVLTKARNGAFDLRLGEALREAGALGCYSGQVQDFGCTAGLSVRSEDADHGDYSTAEETFYTLHIIGISHGTAARIKRYLRSKGVRFY